jgi:hypothetical protein
MTPDTKKLEVIIRRKTKRRQAPARVDFFSGFCIKNKKRIWAFLKLIKIFKKSNLKNARKFAYKKLELKNTEKSKFF